MNNINNPSTWKTTLEIFIAFAGISTLGIVLCLFSLCGWVVIGTYTINKLFFKNKDKTEYLNEPVELEENSIDIELIGDLIE